MAHHFNPSNIQKNKNTFSFNYNDITYDITHPLDEYAANVIFETLFNYLKDGFLLKTNDYNHDLFYCKIYIKEINENHYRIICPDERQHFPWDEDCNPIYKKQLDY